MPALQFTTFGAVKPLDNQTVEIPDDRRADFANAVTYFSAQPNTAKLSVTMDSVKDADLLRAQIKQYAREHNLSAGLPAKDKFGNTLNEGTKVTFRFAPHRDKTTAAPVTTTQDTPAAK